MNNFKPFFRRTTSTHLLFHQNLVHRVTDRLHCTLSSVWLTLWISAEHRSHFLLENIKINLYSHILRSLHFNSCMVHSWPCVQLIQLRSIKIFHYDHLWTSTRFWSKWRVTIVWFFWNGLCSEGCQDLPFSLVTPFIKRG